MDEKIDIDNSTGLRINKGDLVDFGAYGKFYVSDPYSYKNLLWVTPDKRDRYDENSAGMSISRSLAEKVLPEE